MENYFKFCLNIAQIKKKFKELCFKFHPDLGGSEDLMKELNAQYHSALKGQHKTSHTDRETGKEFTYYYNHAVEESVAVKLRELLGKDLPSDVTIDLVGTWIWVYGNTRPVKDKLNKKGANLIFHAKRGMWYYRPESRKAYYSGANFDSIRAFYGSQTEHRKDERLG
jgi:hypothetical protein